MHPQTKASNFQRSVLAAALSALLFAIQSGSQVSEATTFTQRAEALQSALNVWQGTLKAMTFGQAPSVRISLSDRRGPCLEWISTIHLRITRFNKNPALGRQFSLLSSLTFFDNTLLNLRDALQLARTMEQSAAELATLEQDQEKVETIRKELQAFYTDLRSQLFQQLRAATEGSQAGPASHEPGEISGHAYHADTGKPLADVVVTLEAPQGLSGDRLQRTGQDGRYRFTHLAPGNYWVIAYRSGFVGSVYGVGTSQNASKGLISVAPRQNQPDIDFRLSPSPQITTLSGEALEKALTNADLGLVYDPGSFSPDGKQFAFAVTGPDPEQVCLYDLASLRLKCVTGQAEWGFGHAKTGKIGYLAWTGGTLYAQPVLGGGAAFRVVPAETGPVIGPPSQGMLCAFRDQQNRTAGAGLAHFVSGNGNFTVTAWYGQLAMSTPDGEAPFNIATGGKELYSFVFDPQRSVVYYPESGRYDGAIVSFDLGTRLYQTTALPFSEGLKLLDAKREGDTTLAAYTVDGPCVPRALADGEDPWILPNKPSPAAQPASVCLTTIPPGSDRGTTNP